MPSLRDVAESAGVSVSTASKVLNTGTDIHRFSPACIERVRRAAAALRYQANYHAQSLLRGKTMTLGAALDVWDGDVLGGDYLGGLFGGVELAGRKLGYDLNIIGPTTSQTAVDRGLDYLRQQRIDGLVIPGELSAVRQRVFTDNLDLPVVLMLYPEPIGFPVVEVDEAAGLQRAVDHLAELGHRAVLWLGPDLAEEPGTRDREALFAGACLRAGVAARRCTFAPDGPDGSPRDVMDAGHDALAEHLARDRDVTAVLAWNDRVAIGAYGALTSVGLSVPRDVSVVGFDNIHGENIYPKMTCVDHMLREVGMQAVQLLAEMINAPDAMETHHGRRVTLTPELVVRDSTAPCPATA